MDTEQKALYRFLGELKAHIDALPKDKKPSREQIEPIAAQALNDIRSLLAQHDTREEELSSLVTNVGWWEDATRPFRKLDKTGCIIAHIAIGAVILAAWVASGGTLAIGSVIAGVTIDSSLLAALTGGASGRVIAEILCK